MNNFNPVLLKVFMEAPDLTPATGSPYPLHRKDNSADASRQPTKSLAIGKTTKMNVKQRVVEAVNSGFNLPLGACVRPEVIYYQAESNSR
jgi:hypothetical protein